MKKNSTLKAIQIVGGAEGEAGWYAETAEKHRVLGPFLTREDCLNAIEANGSQLAAKDFKGAIGSIGQPY